MKQLIKSIVAILILTSLSNVVLAQSSATAKKPKKETITNHASEARPVLDIAKPDTIYSFQGDKTLNIIYSIFQRGYIGASSSPDFSDNARKQLLRDIRYIDSAVFSPQVVKYHPQKPAVKPVPPAKP